MLEKTAGMGSIGGARPSQTAGGRGTSTHSFHVGREPLTVGSKHPHNTPDSLTPVSLRQLRGLRVRSFKKMFLLLHAL